MQRATRHAGSVLRKLFSAVAVQRTLPRAGIGWSFCLIVRSVIHNMTVKCPITLNRSAYLQRIVWRRCMWTTVYPLKCLLQVCINNLLNNQQRHLCKIIYQTIVEANSLVKLLCCITLFLFKTLASSPSLSRRFQRCIDSTYMYCITCRPVDTCVLHCMSEFSTRRGTGHLRKRELLPECHCWVKSL